MTTDIYRDLIIPLVRQSYSNAEIAKKLETSEAHIVQIVEEAMGRQDVSIYDELIELWEHYIEFGNPWHARLLSLFVLQSYFYLKLPAVFYIGLTGPKATAKTAGLELLKELCPNAVMSGNASVAAAARKLHEGCTLLLDEADEMESEKKDLLFGAARMGYRPGSVYLRYDYKAKNYEEINIYGPKAFAFITDIEEALKSRTIEIPTVRVKEDPFGKVLENLARGIRGFKALREQLASYCVSREKMFPSGGILAILESTDFMDEVKNAAGKEPAPRQIELVAICLLVSKIAGVDISVHTREAMDSQDVFEDEAISELKSYVKDVWGGRQYVKLKELRDGINRARKETLEKPIHHKRLRPLLKELGMREESELKRLGGEGNHILVFTDHAKKMLGLDGSPNPSHTGHGWFTEVLDASRSREPSLDTVKNNEERVKKTCEALHGLCKGGKRSFTFDEASLVSNGICDHSQLDTILKRLKQDGTLYEPKLGEFAFTES